MRTRQEIEAEDHHWSFSSDNTALLEVLLDIRDQNQEIITLLKGKRR